MAAGAVDGDTHFSSYAITLADDGSTDGICGSLEKIKKKKKKNKKKITERKEERRKTAKEEERAGSERERGPRADGS